MKRQSSNSQGSGFKITLLALGLVILGGIVFMAFHDIKVPTKQVSQTTTINLEND